MRSSTEFGGVRQPRSMAASTNICAYGSMNSGCSDVDSCARDHAMPSAVAPTLSVISQLSLSVRAIAIGFPVLGELKHLVLGQQIAANVLLSVSQLADAVGDHRSGDQREQAGEDQHADVGVAAQPDRRTSQH